MRQLNVVLGDFSHTTNMMANNFIPLNIGLIGAFSKKKFGTNVTIHLFKSVPKMLHFLSHNSIDVIGLSHYIWNSNLSVYLLRQYKISNPDGIAVLGGPHFPKEQGQILSWFFKHPYIDFVIDSEGEKAFSNILDYVISCEGKGNKDKEMVVTGCYFLQGDHFVYAPEKNLDNLDDIPSPYLTGLLDQFFLENIDKYELYPLFEHTRGCPFQCTFCRNSVESKKMRSFSIERFVNEVEYVATFMKKYNLSRPTMMIADQNFGMYEDDYLIAEQLQRIQAQYNFPQHVIVTTGKSNYQSVLKTVKSCPLIKMTFSVQSLDKQVLDAVKRKNVPLNLFQHYHNDVRKRDEHTWSEIIVGLPTDSRSKHLATIHTILTMGVDYIIPFSFMMLPGTPAESAVTRKQYSYITKYRLVPGGFSKINDSQIFEIEEIVVATNTMTVDDYIYLRRIHLLVMGGFNGGVFCELRRLLIESGIRFDIYLQGVDSFCQSTLSPIRIVDIFNEFSSKVKEELFESPEQLATYYVDHYPDLLNGRVGENLLQKYVYKLYMEVQDFVEVMIHTFSQIVEETHSHHSHHWQTIFELMRIRSRCIRCFLKGEPPTLMNPIMFVSPIDVNSWITIPSKKLDDVRLEHPINLIMFYPDNLIEKWSKLRGQYGHSEEGQGRVLYRMGLSILAPKIMKP